MKKIKIKNNRLLSNQIPECLCGCSRKVSFYRGKWRKYLLYHNLKTEEFRKIHSERMKGNKLFLGRKHTEKTKKIMSEKQKGENNSVWNGGRTISHGGYITILSPNHPYLDINGRVKEERLMMESKLGHYLTSDEIIHHINGIKDDNRIENLLVVTRSEHSKIHWKMRRLNA